MPLNIFSSCTKEMTDSKILQRKLPRHSHNVLIRRDYRPLFGGVGRERVSESSLSFCVSEGRGREYWVGLIRRRFTTQLVPGEMAEGKSDWMKINMSNKDEELCEVWYI